MADSTDNKPAVKYGPEQFEAADKTQENNHEAYPDGVESWAEAEGIDIEALATVAGEHAGPFAGYFADGFEYAWHLLHGETVA